MQDCGAVEPEGEVDVQLMEEAFLNPKPHESFD